MTCFTCRLDKPLTDFHKNSHNSDGLNHICKTCCAAYHHAYLARPKVVPASGLLVCTGCLEIKLLIAFHTARGTTTGYAKRCKTCCAAYQRQYRQSHNGTDAILSGSLVCPNCHIGKDITEFAKNKTKASGHSYWCRACVKIYNDTYRVENQEQISLQRRGYRQNLSQEDKDRLAQYALAWLKAHPESRRETGKRFYENHPELCNERAKAWRKANPEKVRKFSVMSQARRRAYLRNDPHNDLTLEQWLEILVAYDYKCVYCPSNCWLCRMKRHALTQDHITPISKGGSNTASNIVPCCKSCNSKKGNRDVPVPVQPLLLTIAPSRKL